MNTTTVSYDILKLQKQCKAAHYMLLATVIATVVNILLLFSQIGLHIPYDASLAYYLTLLGYFFDGYALGTYTATGMVMAFGVLAAWLVVWYMARTHRAWLIVGLVLVGLDALFLILFSLLFLQQGSGNLVPLLIHGAVIFEICVGIGAHKKLDQLQDLPPEIPEDICE